MILATFITGLLTSAGLLVAIGAQNTFVIRQGIRQQYVFTVSATCFLCDILLMTLGVIGVGKLINDNKIMMITLTAVGVIFLLWYGYNSLKSAYQGNSQLIVKDDNQKETWQAVILSTLAVSLLNPNVWIDTVAIVGGISSTVQNNLKIFYLSGALAASFLWFFSIGYLASWIAKYFSRDITWRILDLLIGCYMVFMAWKLFMFIFTIH
ncbi:MAG: LysE/ArgO family amino acid transporter [Enterobacteriaceae bacterium]|nr:LysE/ArgO family amino acid transporter [Enterobacteriaceae bacterium]